ncbi:MULTISPECIES: hypothetical protein [unclassified Paenibacillus]|uniref:hypothetical protein n=1 Tax=unclassified Paenibacillus TaxID=185978 RepID=UPI00070AADCB|nr:MULTISPECIES: hypothetical protein [unclassified Paenibacillus]KQX51389.1 hypothetical protein ASD40_35450 [Paenibacillus sp. Root444D2]KRE50007.1 hypothetical protein ASG85_21380 [Paenibacillus sp. Soil724D2]
MNNLKFFVYQVLLSFLGIAVDILFREFIYESSFFNNRYIPALIETSINGVLLYFIFKLYPSLKTTKLRYKILIHIAAFILGAILVGLTGSFLGM